MARDNGVKLIGGTSSHQTMVQTGTVKPKSTLMNIVIDDVHASIIGVDAPENNWHINSLSGDSVQDVLHQIDAEMYDITQNLNELNLGQNQTTPSLAEVVAVGGNVGGGRIIGLQPPAVGTEPVTKDYLDSLNLASSSHPTLQNNPHNTTLAQVITAGNTLSAGQTINASAGRITGIPTTQNATDAINRDEVISKIATHANNSGAHGTTLSTVLGFGSDAGDRKITGLLSPTVVNGAATKGYVDNAVKTTGQADGIILQNADGTLYNSEATLDSLRYGFVATVDYYSELYALSGALSGDVANTRYPESILSGTYSGEYVPGIYRLLGITWSLDNAFIQESYLNQLSGDITAERNSRIINDAILSGMIVIETNTRASGDVVLLELINGLSGSIDAIDPATILSQIGTVSGDLQAEIDARVAADAAHDISIGDLETATSTLTSDLATEVGSRVGMDATKMDLQVGAGIGNVGVFDAAGQLIDSGKNLTDDIMTVIEAAALSGLFISPADILTQEQVDTIVYSGDFLTVESRVTTNEINIAGLSGELAAEIADNTARDDQLAADMASFNMAILLEQLAREAALSGEMEARIAGDVASQVYVDSVISSVSGLPTQVNNLSLIIGAEITARSNGDSALALVDTSLSNRIIGLSGTVNNEIAARLSGDAYLLSLITGNLSGDLVTKAELSGAIQLEINDRIDADLALSGNLQNQLGWEIVDRMSGDAYLLSLITANTSGDFVTYGALSGAINAEMDLRVAADLALSGDIHTHILYLSGDLRNQYIEADSLVLGTVNANILSLSGDLRAQYIAADIIVTDAFGSADLALSGDMVSQFQAADLTLSGNLQGQIDGLVIPPDLTSELSVLSGTVTTVQDNLSGLSGVVQFHIDNHPAGGVSQVYHDNTLTGDGTSGNPLSSTVLAATFANHDFLLDLTPYAMHEPAAGGPEVINTFPVDVSGQMEIAKYDDTLEEYLYGQFRLPSDLNPSGNILLEVEGVPILSGAGNINMRFAYNTTAVSGSLSGSWTEFDSGDQAVTSDPDQLHLIQWSDTIANRGLLSDDMVRYRIARITATSPLAGDFGLTHLRIKANRLGITVAGGSGVGGDFVAAFKAGEFDIPDVNGAPLDKDVGANATQYRHLMDDTTEEFLEQEFDVPNNADPAGTVSFVIKGYAVTASAASGDIGFNIYHNHGTSWDESYTMLSEIFITDPTQDNRDRFVKTATLASLGWSADDTVKFKISRNTDAAFPSEHYNLPGDYGLTGFSIIIERA